MILYPVFVVIFMKLIVCVLILELSNIPGTEGESAINQKVVKKSKKKWVINPVGKSMVNKKYFVF